MISKNILDLLKDISIENDVLQKQASEMGVMHPSREVFYKTLKAVDSILLEVGVDEVINFSVAPYAKSKWYLKITYIPWRNLAWGAYLKQMFLCATGFSVWPSSFVLIDENYWPCSYTNISYDSFPGKELIGCVKDETFLKQALIAAKEFIKGKQIR